MNIHNLALVRATNVIPFDGKVNPISNVPYLCKNIGLEFSSNLSDLLKEKGIIPTLDFSRFREEGYIEKIGKLSSSILQEYLPYVSDYNSMVLFSLNGLCPDDNEHGFSNNTFSNKKCAVIEPLENHLNEVVSLYPTDTAIKGSVVLSKDAIVLIEESTFQSLSNEQKEILAHLTLQVKTFHGNLKEVVYQELKNSGRYIPETLSLTSSTGGFIPSETSEMQKQCINEIATKNNLSQMKFFNLLTSNNSDMLKYDQVCDESENSVIVEEHYMTMFLEELFTVMNVPKVEKEMILENLYNPIFLSELMNKITLFGIENYKKFVDCYNEKLIRQQKAGLLPTPEEIVNGRVMSITE